MRIDLPAQHQDAPIVHLASNYAAEIVRAGVAFSKAGYQHSKLSLREFEGARARTAEINGCTVCQNWRSERDLPGYFSAFGGQYERSVGTRGAAPDEQFYTSVSQWRDSPVFSERERLAIRYAEGLGMDPHGIAKDEEFWRRMKAAFSDDEIVDLSYCIAAWMGLGRVTHALGMDGVCSFRNPAEEAA
ncbi:MAG: carboxymuconolactone decarboxylase family protein [Steroidobacteraceae bacterium]